MNLNSGPEGDVNYARAVVTPRLIELYDRS